MTKLVQGCSRCSSHDTTDTDSRASTTVSWAASGVDTSRSFSSLTYSWRRMEVVGASRPSTTPAIVACRPDWYRASHSPAATAT